MDLKENLLSSHLLFQENFPASSDFLDQIRTESIEKFSEIGFPRKGEEEWKYTNLKTVLEDDLRLNPYKDVTLEYKDLKNYFINDIDSYKLVFVNGVFNSWLSETTHDECDVCILSSATTSNKYKELVEKHYNKIASAEDNMTVLNSAFTKEGAYISVPENTIVSKPIQILFFSSPSHKVINQHRNLIVVGKNAQVQIIERHQNITDYNLITNSVTEVFADQNSILDYYKIQNDTENSSLVDSTYIAQKRDSNVSIHTFSLGGRLIRNNLTFTQNESGVNSTLKGISIIGGNQHVDNHTLVEHKAPNCESHELYKGIFDGKSKGVFNGKITVAKDAQKINAFQQNNNILLSEACSIDSKPQLEIFADDVRCSHGCTVGELDSEALFYLQSRGIPKKEAQALLLVGFASDVLESVKIPQLKRSVNELMANKLNVDIEFAL